MAKRPIFVLPTQGKTREQIKAEARAALFGHRGRRLRGRFLSLSSTLSD